MGLSNHVSLVIVKGSVGISRAGFGIPLVLSVNAPFPELIRYYNDITGVADDGFATDSPEYLAVNRMFSQSPKPKTVAIGRGTRKPTQKYVIGVASVLNDHQYTIDVAGEGVTEETVSVVSDPAAVNDDIVADIVIALNAVVGKNFTAAATGSVGSQVATVTADNPGDWFSLAVGNIQYLSIKQDHIDPGIADDLNAIQLENSDWYGLYTLYNSPAYIEAAATWAEAQTKIYHADTCDSENATTAAGAGGILDTLQASAFARTSPNYYPAPDKMFGAGWMGRVLPIEPGGATWKFKTIRGVPVVTLTATQRKNIVDRNGNSYEENGGVNITFEGTTADGDFIDVQRGLDWLRDDMTKGVFGTIVGAEKVPYTDPGVSVIESEVRASLERAITRGILASDPEPQVEVPVVADVADADKANRVLPDISFDGVLAGAIHKANIKGTVSA